MSNLVPDAWVERLYDTEAGEVRTLGTFDTNPRELRTGSSTVEECPEFEMLEPIPLFSPSTILQAHHNKKMEIVEAEGSSYHSSEGAWFWLREELYDLKADEKEVDGSGD